MSEIKNPAYRVLLPEWEGDEPWFELTPQQRKTILGGSPHRVAPMDKTQPVHERASTCESLLTVYPDAISIGGVMGASVERGDVGFGGLLLAAFSLFLLGAGIFKTGVDELFTWTVIFPMGFIVFMMSFNLIKLAYLLPKDQPILIDRKSRKVVFSQVRFHSFWKFWVMPGFSSPVTVPWDSIQVRSYKFVQYMGSTLRDSYRLELWAPTPDNPRNLLVKEPIGYLGWYEDEKLWQLYEHIRRYMEEGGPAIQHGEKLRKPRKGRDLPAFPEAVLTTLGGPALSDEEVERLAEITPPQAII
ncbi:hypothetical protein [Pseudomonas sp. Hp2]|uniref:hypothetical protein n=1 Tax=Pseudomonas sp. Hp2 TaxID=701189 RepID=UPI0011265D73|nr:hypothetical protein [Pseudomonas sp. Hp2]